MVKKFYDPLSDAAGGAASLATPLGIGFSAAQLVMGGIQAISGENRTKRLLAQRQAYKTPEEVYKALQATQSMASQGYDAFTLQYLNNQIDRGFSESAGVAKKLGADPNQLSEIFDKRMQSVMKVGAENHALNMKNFSAYLNMLGTVANNKTAEWKSEQDIIKDKLQASATDKSQGMANIMNAANAFIGIASADEMGNLYGQKRTKKVSVGDTMIDVRPFLPPSPNAPINPLDIPR